MDKIIVTSIGALLLGGIYWFFFGKKEEARNKQKSVKPERKVVHDH